MSYIILCIVDLVISKIKLPAYKNYAGMRGERMNRSTLYHVFMDMGVISI